MDATQEDIEDVGPKRVAQVSDETVKSMAMKKNAKRTDESTKSAVKILRDYCEETGILFPDNTATAADLDSILSKFYIGARTRNGQMYKINSIKSIRFALQRFFLQSNLVDIINDPGLNESNKIFQNVLKDVKTAGKGETDHYPEVEPEDLQKLHASFDIGTPAGLQEMCWFSIMYYLIRRGRENLREMTKSTFRISTDASGKKFIYQTTSEIDKNHNENDTTNDTNGEGRIYATGTRKCPVACFEKMLLVLNPNIDALWQRPRAQMSIKKEIWFCNVPLGEKTLGGMLATLSVKYNLSQRYTNHSLRVTSIQVLEDANVETRHIVRVSGHKNPDSISSYARRLSAAKKRNLSSILAESVGAARPISVSNQPTMFQGSDDSSIDALIKNMPQHLLNPSTSEQSTSSSQLNIVPGRFAPFLNNCSHIAFNVYTMN